jgi:hypothetical protein
MKGIQYILITTLATSIVHGMEQKPTVESTKLTIKDSLSFLGNQPNTTPSTRADNEAARADRRAAIQRWNAMRNTFYTAIQSVTPAANPDKKIISNSQAVAAQTGKAVTLSFIDGNDDDDDEDSDDDIDIEDGIDRIIADMKREIAKSKIK